MDVDGVGDVDVNVNVDALMADGEPYFALLKM